MRYIFIHGLGQSASSWDKLISIQTKLAYISCPDLFTILNHREATYTNLYKAFSEYCDDISETLSLCGISLGGILALNYALDHPSKVQAIVLIGTQYRMPKTLLKFQNLIFRLMPRKSFTKLGFQKEDIIKLTNTMMNLDFSRRLKDISCKTFIICGEKDNANKKAAKNLAKSISNAKLYIVKNAGHEINIEAPEKLAAILADMI